MGKVVVVDYGVGNLLSVCRGLEQVGASVVLTSDPETILGAERLVLPGVGAFPNAMEALHGLGLVPILKDVAARHVPLLGICLGMQLLFDESEEFGTTQGLGLIPGNVRPIPDKSVTGEPLKIPHIGWNGIKPSSDDADWSTSCLARSAPNEAMYFVHSFQALPSDPSFRLADCEYGGHAISAVVSKGSVTGCQFHPEKSGQAGLNILQAFCGL
ncbi:MAG: imidazole glycerol phosphate synthase, glutamine amidotransferase subunit [Rhodocyclaceae bacterium]|nr:imidazole glycerol phosphate synthase, glutamine amidotransferase subunit [Rhodocyclaceae bacterium]